jgi:predicted amidohydrolase
MLVNTVRPSGYHQKLLILKNKTKSTLKVGIAQIAPVWLDRDATVAKVTEWIRDAASQGCRLVVFGEALVPGYPFWVERTDGARFESDLQKELYRHYVEQSVCIEAGDIDSVRDAARENAIAVYLGIMERRAAYPHARTLYGRRAELLGKLAATGARGFVCPG